MATTVISINSLVYISFTIVLFLLLLHTKEDNIKTTETFFLPKPATDFATQRPIQTVNLAADRCHIMCIEQPTKSAPGAAGHYHTEVGNPYTVSEQKSKSYILP